MNSRTLLTAAPIAAALLLALPTAVQAEPASTLQGMWAALGACSGKAKIPAEAVGSEVTVLLTMKRDGSLLGQPRITHSRLVGDETSQKDYLASVLGALAACFPLQITDGLGGAVAGRPLRYRIVSGVRQASQT